MFFCCRFSNTTSPASSPEPTNRPPMARTLLHLTGNSWHAWPWPPLARRPLLGAARHPLPLVPRSRTGLLFILSYPTPCAPNQESSTPLHCTMIQRYWQLKGSYRSGTSPRGGEKQKRGVIGNDHSKQQLCDRQRVRLIGRTITTGPTYTQGRHHALVAGRDRPLDPTNTEWAPIGETPATGEDGAGGGAGV